MAELPPQSAWPNISIPTDQLWQILYSKGAPSSSSVVQPVTDMSRHPQSTSGYAIAWTMAHLEPILDVDAKVQSTSTSTGLHAPGGTICSAPPTVLPRHTAKSVDLHACYCIHHLEAIARDLSPLRLFPRAQKFPIAGNKGFPLAFRASQRGLRNLRSTTPSLVYTSAP